ncbi:SPFH domain-containing protein, partial [Salmonella sp. s54836]|uniref:SPFH domain-containing protein n=1 Tax=Salmonella sp. s54836 TaxID=3159673 RepID=UPI00397F285D
LTQKVIRIDKRLRTLDVPPQEIITRDGVSVNVDAVVNYRVQNCVFAVNNVVNYEVSTRYLSQTTLRNLLGAQSLAEIMSDRDRLSTNIRQVLDKETDQWGIKVERVDIKD